MNYSKTSSQTKSGHLPIRVGLVGVTGYGAAYFEALSNLVDEGRVQWTAVTIINPNQAAEEVAFFQDRSIPIYSDFFEMLDGEKDRLDWVCIPTGISWHTKMVVAALKYGLQVTVEKPITPTLQDLATIQAAEQESGIEVSVGFQYAYQQDTWDIKRRLVEGEIGEIKHIDCIAIWPRNRTYYTRNRWSGKLHDGHSWVLDSPLHNALCHMTNLVLFWSGKTIEKEAELNSLLTETYRSKPIDSFDTIRSVVKMDSGVEASVLLSHSSHQFYDPEVHIVGTKGKIIWRFAGDYEVIANGETKSYPKLDRISLRNYMFNAIVEKMEGKSTRMCTSDLAKGTVKWVNAVHDTAQIQCVPEQFCKPVKSEDGEVVDTIDDLEYYAIRSFRERKSFKELDAPWAVEPQGGDISGYSAFEGKYCPVPFTVSADIDVPKEGHGIAK